MLHPYAIAFEQLWRATAARPPDDDEESLAVDHEPWEDRQDAAGAGGRREASVPYFAAARSEFVEMIVGASGFDPRSRVVVMAATNRAEMFDDALTRAGRFDREIEVAAAHPGRTA